MNEQRRASIRFELVSDVTTTENKKRRGHKTMRMVIQLYHLTGTNIVSGTYLPALCNSSQNNFRPALLGVRRWNDKHIVLCWCRHGNPTSMPRVYTRKSKALCVYENVDVQCPTLKRLAEVIYQYLKYVHIRCLFKQQAKTIQVAAMMAKPARKNDSNYWKLKKQYLTRWINWI